MTQSSAIFTTMDLHVPAGPDNDNFVNSFSFMRVLHLPLLRPKPHRFSTRRPKPISDTKTCADHVRINDLEMMTETHHRATVHANQIIASQQLRIEQLSKAQSEEGEGNKFLKRQRVRSL
jgi:hypothetical protein